MCRWIRFEDDVEVGGERWSKPHVATLSLHSLFELRKGIMTGTVLLDMAAVTVMQVFGLSFTILSTPHFTQQIFHTLNFCHNQTGSHNNNSSGNNIAYMC